MKKIGEYWKYNEEDFNNEIGDIVIKLGDKILKEYNIKIKDIIKYNLDKLLYVGSLSQWVKESGDPCFNILSILESEGIIYMIEIPNPAEDRFMIYFYPQKYIEYYYIS